MGHLSPKFTRQPQRDGQAVLCSGDRVRGTYRKVLVRYQKGRPGVPKVFSCTKPGVEAGSGHKASSAQEPLELVLQAAASHKKSF